MSKNRGQSLARRERRFNPYKLTTSKGNKLQKQNKAWQKTSISQLTHARNY